jgi:hypothetical protein
MHRLSLGSLAVLVLLGLMAPAARADITVDALTLTPSTTAAGQPAQIAMHAEFSTGDAVKDLVVHLPPGLVGNPRAVGACPQAQFAADPSTCPAAAKVGTTSVGTTLIPVSGDVYNLVPDAGEPARLGVSLMNGSIKQTVLASLRADGGLDTIIRDLPNRDPVLGVPLAVKSLDLTLDKRFMTNPTSCGAGAASVDATSYGGAHGSRSTTFTTDRCAALPFAPKLTASVDALGPKEAVHSPALQTLIAVPAGDAAIAKTVVTLPPRVTVDVSRIKKVCTLEQQAADACPPESTIGSVRAQTPLLAAPLTGPVQLAAVPGGVLPGLRLTLGGAVQLRLAGSLVLGKPIDTVFDGIPDTPLSTLALAFAGGSPLKVIGDPCTGGLLRMTGAFTGHNGAQASSPTRVKVRGCPVRGRARASKGPGPKLVLDASKGRDAKALQSVRFRFPSGLTTAGGRVRASADGRPVAASAVQVTDRTVTVRVAGAKAVTIRMDRGALRGRAAGVFRLDATRVNGRHFALKLATRRLR